MEASGIRRVVERLRAEVGRVVMGQERNVDLLAAALLAEGHVLLEGVPGTAKTLLAQAFARALDLQFRRIQFTPDLMPADVVGTNLFDFRTNAFVLTRGPIFTEILLADEINRTPPKTQAALLESMQERSVTLDGTTHELSPAFTVIATQNPIEHEGTYPLPEAQLDRFLFKLVIGYPERAAERAMVALHGHRSSMPRIDEFGIERVADGAFVAEARERMAEVHLSDPVLDYVVDLVRATREHPALLCGASPRAANMLATASRAMSALQGTDFVLPDVVKDLAPSVLAHRVILAPGAEIEGGSAAAVIAQVLEQVPAPR